MPLCKHPTLTRYLIEQRRRFPGASGDFNALILDVSIACKAVARRVANGALEGADTTGSTNVHGEEQQPLDLVSNEMLIRQTEWSGQLAGIGSEEMAAPYQIPATYQRGKYLLLIDPLDGSSNIDVNVSVGSIFSILRAPDDVIESGRDVTEADFLQPGAAQVAAGYAIYGPSTELVLTVGNGTHGFTLDREIGNYVLTRRDLRIPESTSEYAINAANRRFWEPPVMRYVDECKAGREGPRERDFNTRWVASLVADIHRILVRGGVYLYPRDQKPAHREGRLRLMYEANPMSFLVEQAGGLASTGRGRIMEVEPRELHQRVPMIMGSREEVERLDQYHAAYDSGDDQPYSSPLFTERSLFINT